MRERLNAASSEFTEYEKADSFFWAVKLADQVVGNVVLQNVSRMMLTAEIGYGVSATVRGRGIGGQAVRLISQRVFAQTPIRKLIAFVHEDNLASRRLLEKVGFRQEGLLREHYLVNGQPANEAVYGLLRGELR